MKLPVYHAGKSPRLIDHSGNGIGERGMLHPVENNGSNRHLTAVGFSRASAEITLASRSTLPCWAAEVLPDVTVMPSACIVARPTMPSAVRPFFL